MNLYLLRHGLAGQHTDPAYKDDSLRPLTQEGREQLYRSSLGMKALNLKFDAILSSPYVRAYETAAIVADAYKLNKKKFFLTDNLLPPASIKSLLNEASTKFPKARHVLCVGHEPHLSELISALLESKKPLPVDFKKGALCCLEIKQTHACLQWFLTPKQLGMLAQIK